MGGIILWLLFTAISGLILYVIIRAAINHSDITNQNGEVRTINNQLNRQHQEMMKQMEDLKQIIIEQNLLLREMKLTTNKE